MVNSPLIPDEDDVAAIVEEIVATLKRHKQPHFAARQVYTQFIAPGRTADQVAELADKCPRVRNHLPLFFRPDPIDPPPAA